jgi:hypothetical protein
MLIFVDENKSSKQQQLQPCDAAPALIGRQSQARHLPSLASSSLSTNNPLRLTSSSSALAFSHFFVSFYQSFFALIRHNV